MKEPVANWLYGVWRPFRWELALVATLLGLSSLVGLLTPWPFQILLDNVFGSHPWPRWLLPMVHATGGRRFALVLIAAAAMLVTSLLSSAVSTVATYRQVALSQRLVFSVRCRLFEHYQRLSLAFHERQSVGDTLYSLDSDAYAPTSLLIDGVLPIATDAIQLTVMFAVLWKLNVSVAIAALLVVPFLLLAIRYNARYLEAGSEIVRERESDVFTAIHESFSAIRLVAAFAREREEQRRFENRSETALRERMALTRREMLFAVGLDLVLTAGTSLVVVVVGYNILHGRMTVGLLWVAITYLGNVYGPLHTISSTVGGLKEGLVGVRRVKAVLDREPEVRERPDAVELEPPVGTISFRDVSFTYPGGEEILHRISFEAKPGETIAIVGPTGTGKSTLLGLALRFHDPTEGTVTAGGRDMRDLTLRSLREHIAVVTQDTLLVRGTIRENIRFGRPDASEEDIIRAAKMASAHDFIIQLPDGYETVLGEGGAGLSGGQSQRIAIARAFMKDAPVLVLDEPTSALDVATEREVVAAWRDLMRGRTTLIATHRLSTVAEADHILVIQDGRVTEEGPPALLLAGSGPFARWHRLHVGEARPAGPDDISIE